MVSQNTIEGGMKKIRLTDISSVSVMFQNVFQKCISRFWVMRSNSAPLSSGSTTYFPEVMTESAALPINTHANFTEATTRTSWSKHILDTFLQNYTKCIQWAWKVLKPLHESCIYLCIYFVFDVCFPHTIIRNTESENIVFFFPTEIL